MSWCLFCLGAQATGTQHQWATAPPISDVSSSYPGSQLLPPQSQLLPSQKLAPPTSEVSSSHLGAAIHPPDETKKVKSKINHQDLKAITLSLLSERYTGEAPTSTEL